MLCVIINLLGTIFKITSYHPSQLFAEKRRLRFAREKEDEAKNSELPKIDVSKAEQNAPQVTGTAKLLSDAQDFVDKAKELLTTISQKFGEMTKIVSSATDVTIDDNDRKKMNTKLQEMKAEFDNIVKTNEVGGTKLFSGEFAKEPKRLALEENGDKSMDFRVEAISTEGLKVDRFKIDSLVNARKATQAYELANSKIADLLTNFKSKQDMINFQISKLPRDEIEVETKKATSTTKEPPMPEWKKYQLKQIRHLQEELAKASNETLGLLIKVEV